MTPNPTEPTSKGQDPNVTAGRRWHFHNYWGTSPNLTVFDADVHFEAGLPSGACCPPRVVAGSAAFGPPPGRIIPPETGRIDVNVAWTPGPPLPEAVNVSYLPANAREFILVGSVPNGGNATFSVTEDMADVAHRGHSVWKFRIEPAPGPGGIGLANGTIHVKVVATIGRPIFIDPPHIDHWKGETTLPVLNHSAEVRGAKLPGSRYLAVEGESAREGKELASTRPVDGALIPEGTRVLLARLAWSSSVPGAPWKLGLLYREDNSVTEGALTPESDEPGLRVYRLPVSARMTDSPYSNQSTWTFTVHVDGDASPFEGTFKLDVWASRLAPDEATIPAEETASGGSRGAETGSSPTPPSSPTAIPIHLRTRSG